MLGILGLSIMVFFVALTRYLSNRIEIPESSPPVGTATLSPTLSNTIAVPVTPSTTPRPSWTPPASPTTTITRTITPTLTRTIVPSLTPANPQTANTRYRLAEWNLVSANQLIELVTARAENEQDQEWYRAAAYTLQEALLRFPQSVNSSAWRWQMARYQLLAGDTRALDTYANLLQAALQAGQARINDLPAWFHRNAPELHLSTTTLPAEPGELNRLLIQISGAGNGFLWSIGTPGNVQVTPLLNNFDPTNDPQAASLTADLTGDGQAELIIYETSNPTQTHFPSPWIFDLAQQPPSLMPIQSSLPLELGTESERLVNIQAGIQAVNELQILARMFPTCPVEMTRSYQWDGEMFTISSPQVESYPDPTLLGWCEILVEHASLEWAPELTLAVAEPLLASWPPAENAEGDPYPDDALDAWRFRLGVLHALAGHQPEALQYFQTIIDDPTSAESSWIEPATAFTITYQGPEDLYRACLAAPGCNLHHAIHTMVASSGISSPALARQYLLQNGVVGRTAGYLDFDGDGSDEAWLNLRPTAEGKLEFWILVATTTGVQAVYVQIFESNAPQPYFHDPEEIPPVVQLERGRGFILERDPLTGESAIRFLDVEYSRPTFIRDELNSATQALFFGVDPAWGLSELHEIRSSPRFAGDCVAFGICARFYYTLGLADELTGNQLSAIDWYLTTWREYPLSPFTLMARLKLELIPATPTSTPTITLTPTITNTPDPLRTATQTTLPYNPPLYTPTPGVYP
jgi:hypothetical protein